MTVSVIRWDDHQLVPWKNGKGMTREVANDHDGDGRMLWRISLATVDRDGPFSDFSGYKRIIMMLSGAGMTLDFGEHGKAVMDRPFEPVTFDGAWPTSATLHGGETRDLNVVTAQGRLTSRVAVFDVTRAPTTITPGGHLTFIHALEGAAAATVDGATHVLERADTLRIDGGGGEVALAASGQAARLYRIDIDLA